VSHPFTALSPQELETPQNRGNSIARTRFGVVVLSHAFFAKNWSGYELDGLVVREMSGGKQIILPLWHNISKDEIIAQSPTLADKVALQTATSTVAEIAEQIAAVVAEAEGSQQQAA
jgi:hypothetical protein